MFVTLQQTVQVQEERAHPGDVQRVRRRAQRGGDVAGVRDHQAARGAHARRRPAARARARAADGGLTAARAGTLPPNSELHPYAILP